MDFTGIDKLVSAANGANQSINSLANIIKGVFPRTFGTFTLAATSTMSVPQPATLSNSVALLVASNTSAALLMGSAKFLFPSSYTAGSGFVVSTANGSAASGNETFAYVLFNPV